MLWQPAYMGALPVFVLCMLALPGFLWLVERVGTWALLAPFSLYALVQLTPIATPPLGGTGIAFEPMAWQLMFMLGVFLGRRALLGLPPVPRHPWLVGAAVAVVGFGLWYKLIENGLIDGPALPSTPIIGKERLAFPRVVHALALAYLVAVMVPPVAGWMERRPFPALAAIGRQSLNVFCVGLFLSWGVTIAFRLWPAAQAWLDPLLIVIGTLLLWRVAVWSERRRGR
jgi:hypothetical protein